jgi:integrase
MAQPALKVLPGGSAGAPRNRFLDAWEWFRTEKEGDGCSPKTIEYYRYQVLPFLEWLARQHPEVQDFPELVADHLRSYRAWLAKRPRRYGGQLDATTLLTSHKAIRTFLKWIQSNNRQVQMDPALLEFRRPRQPYKQAVLFDISELRSILACCETPAEQLAVRLLVGAGLRESELCGFCLKGPDGSPDLIPDPTEQGRFLLRVRWDGGSKGRKTRYVPISVKLAAHVKRYVAISRPTDSPYPQLLISRQGRPFKPEGVKSMMNRFKRRLGFRVHAHAFRHTYATASVQMDINLEKLRAAMGHADYDTLLRYVKLASERPLGPAKDWAEFIYVPARSLEH